MDLLSGEAQFIRDEEVLYLATVGEALDDAHIHRQKSG